MVLWGLAALGSGAALLPAARYMPAVFLSLGAMSIGSVASAQLPCLTVVNNWFRRRRAVAMSIMVLPATAAFTLVRLRPHYLRLIVVMRRAWWSSRPYWFWPSRGRFPERFETVPRIGVSSPTAETSMPSRSTSGAVLTPRHRLIRTTPGGRHCAPGPSG